MLSAQGTGASALGAAEGVAWAGDPWIVEATGVGMAQAGTASGTATPVFCASGVGDAAPASASGVATNVREGPVFLLPTITAMADREITVSTRADDDPVIRTSVIA